MWRRKTVLQALTQENVNRIDELGWVSVPVFGQWTTTISDFVVAKIYRWYNHNTKVQWTIRGIVYSVK